MPFRGSIEISWFMSIPAPFNMEVPPGHSLPLDVDAKLKLLIALTHGTWKVNNSTSGLLHQGKKSFCNIYQSPQVDICMQFEIFQQLPIYKSWNEDPCIVHCAPQTCLNMQNKDTWALKTSKHILQAGSTIVSVQLPLLHTFRVIHVSTVGCLEWRQLFQAHSTYIKRLTILAKIDMKGSLQFAWLFQGSRAERNFMENLLS